MKNHFIYLYTFPNGKYYVGQTYEGSGRFGRIKAYKKYQAVYDAMMKHKHFEADILKDNLTLDEANYWETYYILEYDSIIDHGKGYNMDYGGNNHTLSERSKTKISNANKGKHNSIKTEFKQGQEPWNKGKTNTWTTDETRKKAIEARKIKIMDNNNNEYDSIIEAARILNLDSSTITKVCKGKLKSTGGYKFSYKEGD